MPIRPPLTKADLQAIQARNESTDVRALLWEIKRLRGTISYADQLQRVLGDLGGAQAMILQALRAKLKDEPCVKEFPHLPPEG